MLNFTKEFKQTEAIAAYTQPPKGAATIEVTDMKLCNICGYEYSDDIVPYDCTFEAGCGFHDDPAIAEELEVLGDTASLVDYVYDCPEEPSDG